MKRHALFLMCCLGMLVVAGGALAADAPAKKSMGHHAKGAMHSKSMYMVESPHTEEECLNVMDEVNKTGPKELESWQWGCMSGNHTGYRMVMASDETAALAMVPEDVRAKAHAYKVSRMTAAQLEAAHKHKM